jgi:hypothetical protein
MDELLNHPAIQAAAAPFFAGLLTAGLLYRARLGGLAVIAGFAAAVALISGFNFTPLTATRKIILLAPLSPLLGVGIDLLAKPTRSVAAVITALSAIAALWVFWGVLAQKEFSDALRLGGIVAVATGLAVGLMLSLASRPVRAASAGLCLGLGAGIGSVLAASTQYGQYGIALGASCGAVLLLQMLLGRGIPMGITLALSASLPAALLGSAAFVLASLPWPALFLIALVPLAARTPLPERIPVWLQAILASIAAMLPALAAFYLTWTASTGTAG